MAIVGCGAVAEICHIPALRRCRWGVLTAIVDSNAERARAAAERHQAGTWFVDYRDLCGKADAAVVATSNATHAEITCFLLEHRIHVLCEKPLATSVSDATRMIASARLSGARLMAGHCRRFNPNVALLKELLSRRALGPLTTISAALGGRYGQWPQRTDFRRERSLAGGGVLVDLGTHLIDLAIWLAGERPTVASYDASDTLGWGIESDADVLLRFPGATNALVSCSYTRGLNRTLRVEGRDGWAQTSVDVAPVVTFVSGRARVCQRAGAQQLLVDEADPHERQLNHFLDALLTDRPFSVDLDEILAGLQVIATCYQLSRAA